MSRLWDIATRPFDKFRYRGDVIPDYVASTYLGDVLAPTPTISSLSAGAGKRYRPKKSVQKVAVDNGYWASLMLRDQTAIDHTDAVAFDWELLAGGGTQTIIDMRVPEGRGWHIDNMYFFATAIGGIGQGVYLLGPAALSNTLIFTVFVNSSQLAYTAYPTTGIGVNTVTSFPFINDRIGPREAKFGVTLFGGEVIRAQARARIFSNGDAIPPQQAVATLGFRFMGISGSRAAMEDYLRLKRWDM